MDNVERPWSIQKVKPSTSSKVHPIYPILIDVNPFFALKVHKIPKNFNPCLSIFSLIGNRRIESPGIIGNPACIRKLIFCTSPSFYLTLLLFCLTTAPFQPLNYFLFTSNIFLSSSPSKYSPLPIITVTTETKAGSVAKDHLF
jgi:hypothetical protein